MVEWLENLTPSSVPDRFMSFSCGQVNANELLATPAGMVIVEKAVNSNSFGIRVCLPFISGDGFASILEMAKIMPEFGPQSLRVLLISGLWVWVLFLPERVLNPKFVTESRWPEARVGGIGLRGECDSVRTGPRR